MSTNLISTFQHLGLATTGSAQTTAGSVQSLSQSDFLSLLTTQLTHQDPTNPTDSNQFIGQMAQFSTVSGIKDLLTSFQSLSSSLTADQSLQAANLVGKTVSTPGNQAYLSAGGSVSGDFNLSTSTTDAKLTISNDSGSVVNQIDLGAFPAGTSPFHWDGKDSSGNSLPSGVYKIQITAMQNGKNTAVNTNIQSLVESVSLQSGNGGFEINLHGLGSVPFSKVQSII
jgi:flagellar basal-body rod modification protein FlgD